MRTGRTDSSLSYALKRSGHAAAYCSLSVACGTRAEGSRPEGTAHFVEHAIFRGTQNRTSEQINSCLDSLGGELNAFTTKEEIVLQATVLKEDLGTAVDLLMDLAFNATFPQEEVETERGVVLDEIISSLDSPQEDIYDEFESRLFAGSPLSRRILGTRKSIKSAKVEDLRSYYKEHFIPANMVLSIVADIEEEKLEEYVQGGFKKEVL